MLYDLKMIDGSRIVCIDRTTHRDANTSLNNVINNNPISTLSCSTTQEIKRLSWSGSRWRPNKSLFKDGFTGGKQWLSATKQKKNSKEKSITYNSKYVSLHFMAFYTDK